MTLFSKMTAAATCLCLVAPAGVALAQNVNSAIKARQGQMQAQSHNAGILFGMAGGKMEYDADMAQAAADNLVALTSVNQSVNWPAGSDTMSVDGSRALPAIWDNVPDLIAKYQALGAAARDMQAVAGTGLDGVKSAIGPIGQACQACHETYRAPNN